MADRTELSAFLHSVADNVYFQPGRNTTLKYPCILYEPNDYMRWDANNQGYILHSGFSVTYISKQQDSDVPEKILMGWPQSSYNTYFVNDNLYHTVLLLYI